MKKFVVALIVGTMLSLTAPCYAYSGDISDDIGVDRVAHFGVSYLVCDQLHRNCGMNKFWSAVTTIAIGAAKEKWIDDHFDNGDFAADCAGTLFCVTFEGHSSLHRGSVALGFFCFSPVPPFLW